MMMTTTMAHPVTAMVPAANSMAVVPAAPMDVLYDALVLGGAAQCVTRARRRRGLAGSDRHHEGGACTQKGQQQFTVHNVSSMLRLMAYQSRS